MIVLFCGVPGSGKTAVAEILSETLAGFGRGKLIVSDEISGKVYKRIFRLLKEGLNEMDYILVDATFYKKRWREMVGTAACEILERIIYLRNLPEIAFFHK